LRIGLIIYGTLQTVSGGYFYDRQLIAHLRETGDEIHIISLPWRNYPHHLLYNFSAFTAQKITELKLDILLQDELNHPSLMIINRSLADMRQRPKISIVHHLRMNEHLMAGRVFQTWIEKKYLKSVDGFIFNSQTTAASVARFAGKKPSVVAFPGKNRFSPGITKKQIAARSHSKGQLAIVFLGNITPRKGLATLIRSLLSLPRDEWKLTVIGSLDRNRAYSQEILKGVRSNRLETNIIFTGQIPNADVAAHLRNNHVLVVPSQYEGYGIAYVEAMGFGLPAIGTTAGGAQEIIVHNVNGFLMAPNDIAALTEYLRSLNRNRAMLERMSINALASYERCPSWQDTVRKIREFLVRFLSESLT
jgi:glycosyltransferase involved in cell wall biosynthesis